MPDIGFGEVVLIAVLALLVFGPDRLPKVAADAGRMLRQVRDLATSARRDLIDAAGLETDDETRAQGAQTDPRRALGDEPTPGRGAEPGPVPATGARPQPTAATADPTRGAVQDWT